RRLPALFLGELGVDEVEAKERMALVLDAPVHVHAAFLAGITLDRRLGIDNRELLAVRFHADLVARHDRDLREERALRLPALGAAADVVVRGLRPDRHLDPVLRAVAPERPTCEIRRRGFQATIHLRVYLDIAHREISRLRCIGQVDREHLALEAPAKATRPSIPRPLSVPGVGMCSVLGQPAFTAHRSIAAVLRRLRERLRGPTGTRTAASVRNYRADRHAQPRAKPALCQHTGAALPATRRPRFLVSDPAPSRA